MNISIGFCARSAKAVLLCLSLVSTGWAQSNIDSISLAKVNEVLQGVKVTDKKLQVPKLPKGFQAQLIGSDNQAIVALNGQVYQPLVNKTVNLVYKITKDKGSAEVAVKNITVAGKFAVQGTNKKPLVIPSLREWHGSTGFYKFNRQSAIVMENSSASLKKVAELLQEDLRKLGYDGIAIQSGTPKAGDIFIGESKATELGAEGYELAITDVFSIRAPQYTGAVFGTRTFLQLLVQEGREKAIPMGVSRDYPAFEVRGLVLDVGRKFFSIDFLRKYVEFMSYYKMSNFHIHLNDNGFKKFFDNNWDSTYAGFRLASDVYPNLASKDGHYTKQEFIDLQHLATRYGIQIIPEIDVPAHSLSFAHMLPELGSDKYGKDHLDLNNPKVYEVVKNIFDEYTKGPNPVFIGEEVHIGTDEYDKSESEKFRAFTDFLIKTVQANGKKVRAWGALTHAKGKTPVTTKDVSLNMWYNGYADPIEMKKLGYSQISTPDGWLYIVPAAGYYYDYLNVENLYNNWEPNKIGNVTFEKGDPIVRGGMFALWNDVVGNGISHQDAHARVFPAMQALSEKMWSSADENTSLVAFNARRAVLTEAPGMNLLGKYTSRTPLLLHYSFDGQVDNQSVNRFPAATVNQAVYDKGVQGQGLVLTESTSLKLPIAEIGEKYTVSFWINKKQLSSSKSTFFKSANAEVFFSKEGLGFTRDGYQYSFDYQPNAGEWTFITIVGDRIKTNLFVNGKLAKSLTPATVVLPTKDGKDKDGKDKFVEFKKVQTLVFPLAEIGGAQATIDELKVYNTELSGQEILSEYKSYPKN